VPKSLKATTKSEMKRLTDIDVFNRSSYSEWAAPTFIQAKKTGDVRILTDFRRLNAQIRRKPFTLPKISDLLRKPRGFRKKCVPLFCPGANISTKGYTNGCENKPRYISNNYV
jgi:hypothetical protein